MPKPAPRARSGYSRDALTLLGQMIRRARLERQMTAAELAERVGVSRGVIQRIEQAEPGCAIGAVFEAAAVLGVRLFDASPAELAQHLATHRQILTLLPLSARPPTKAVKDDF